MKVIQINAAINTTTGQLVPKGAIVVLAEGYAKVKAETVNGVPCQIPCDVYESVEAYNSGKSPILNISDFSSSFGNLMATPEQFLPIRTFLLAVVEGSLDAIYGDENVEIIEI